MSELSRDQARAIDRVATEDWGLPGIVLMENAARGIADVITSLHPPVSGRIVVVCGPGNNGGDGFAAARHLGNRRHEVEIQLVASEGSFSPDSDSGINLQVARRMGIPIRNGIDLPHADFVIDALFGTGLNRPLREPYLSAIGAINSQQAPVLSIDIPSGLDADNGSIHGAAVRARWTATMVAPKTGFLLGHGPEYTGIVEIVDIGLPRRLVRQALGEADDE